MSKFAIYQLDSYKDKSTPKYQVLKNYCCHTVKTYAQKYKIDYFCINLKSNNHYYNDKIQTYKYMLTSNYTKTLFLDMDIIVMNHAENIFDTEFDDVAGCLTREEITDQGISQLKRVIHNKDLINNIIHNSVRYNGGVLMFNNSTKLFDKINNYSEIDNNIVNDDEVFLMYKISGKDITKTILPNYWNTRGLNMNNIRSLSKNYFLHLIASNYNDEGIHKNNEFSMETIIKELI